MQIISLVIILKIQKEIKNLMVKKRFEVYFCRNDTHFKLYYYF
jgi:hypothetical protein